MTPSSPGQPALDVERFGPTDSPLCYIYRVNALPAQTVFPAPSTLALQVGFIVHPAGHEIPRHIHKPIERQIAGTSEVLLVLRGRCEVDIFDSDQGLLATRELRLGDVMVMAGGGHGFRMHEDTVLFEIKQGPYFGPQEKEHF